MNFACDYNLKIQRNVGSQKKQYLKVVFVFVIVVTIYLGDLFGFCRLEEYFIRNSFSSR